MTDAPKDAPVKPPRRRPRLHSRAPSSKPDDGDGWMLTYMDTVTLLITLFVILLSFSTINKEKFDAVADGLSLSKYGAGILTGKPRQAPRTATAATVESVEPIVEPGSEDAPPPGIEEGIRDELARQGLEDMVQMKVHKDLVDLQLNENVLFTSGEAHLSDTGLSVLSRLAPFLSSNDWALSVEGHTDDVPIATDQFPSNWELSASRAASVARKLVEDGLAETRIHIRGYAATRPVVANDGDAGRAMNRRVNLVLQRPGKGGPAGATGSDPQ